MLSAETFRLLQFVANFKAMKIYRNCTCSKTEEA